ncbi:hypothetical protein BBO99_00005665 [Phytophthora kernoviae]|uniref:DDE-1 domain-containing protein n=2 Tax=Phytophthora kernoviae TaxID=325452 RepID=A0A3R7IIP7_9STRA|nr:hypothetical protein G195_006515 [Phytophthora kernoviae 00238/432]KAG2523274.1 hypothetical protein JM16_005392 [Phytophthora kernoviae]KAG2525057.1 hypothetical protein JM18_005041 [Phytophthora kernoviae]RLN20579.1 hypothetical protein BBI17_005658 [Phytophthora kernoviae]RLN78862.1 hypothetical protein BBO99_00005665 [Phytophthora kernoviae]
MTSASNKRRADGEQEAAEVGDAAVAAAAFVDAASAPGTGTATALSNGNLTNYQRKIICEFYRKSGGVMSQKDLAQWTKHEFGLKKTPAQSTISGILRRQHEFVNMSSQELGIKKRRVVQHPQLDSALANWVIQCAHRGITVQGDLTKEKAKHFAKIETDKYEPKNIFALEETAVLYTLPPTQSAIVEDPMRGKKRVVVSLAANAEGSEKLQPLFISHHEHPKCFRKKSAEQHGLHYFWNNKAWMTGVIFSRWLQRLDFAMANQKRRILLFINEVPSHVVTHLELTNVVVFILPNGASQMLNPITSRVVTMFKKRFRRYHLRHAIDKVDSPKGAMFDVDVLQAMKWASASWDEITTETIKRAWIPTNLLRERMGLEEHDLLQEEEEVLLDTELEHLMLFLRLTDPVPIMEYLNDEAMSENTVHEEFFDIVDNVCDVPEDEVDESVEETPGRNLSLQEKLKAFRDVLHVLKERSDADDSALNALRRVQDAIRMEGQKEALGSLNTNDAKNSLDLSESVVTATSSAMSSLEVDGQQHMDAAALLESSESSALSAASASLAESTGDHTDAMLGSATDGVARQSGNDDFHAVI